MTSPWTARDQYVDRPDADPAVTAICDELAAIGIEPWAVLGTLANLVSVARAFGRGCRARGLGVDASYAILGCVTDGLYRAMKAEYEQR